MKNSIALIFLLNSLTCFSTNHFYKDSYPTKNSAYEDLLVRHTKDSFERAMRRESNLNNSRLESPEFFKDIHNQSPHGLIPYLHIVNNLCSLQDAAHLHIGLYTGASFICALLGNEKHLTDKIGIDWYVDDKSLRHKEICLNACNKYLEKKDFTFLVSDCFAVDISLFKRPIDIYVYDAGHAMLEQEMAFTYYNSIFAKTFIAVVDDWAWDQVREGTFKAFDKLNYEILYECEIPSGDSLGNGQYIAVIRKTA